MKTQMMWNLFAQRSLEISESIEARVDDEDEDGSNVGSAVLNRRKKGQWEAVVGG